MNFGAYWFSDKMVLRAYSAREVTEAEAPQLYRIVHNLTLAARMPMPKVYIIPSESPNAFATGRNPSHAAVAVTEGLMRMMNEREITGVLAHELAHVKNRDILISTIAATLAGVIVHVANMLQWGAMFGFGRSDDDEGGSNFIGMMIMIILAPMAAMLIQMAISRTREFSADETGARICGDPGGLASALRKLGIMSQRIPMDASPQTSHLFIVNPLLGGGWAKWFSTHPPMEERIARLEAMAGAGGERNLRTSPSVLH
jgi:heat shock protein HtpX